MSELFVPPFCISILKVLWTKFFIVHCISMYSIWFRSTFFRVFKFLQIKEGGSNFWGEPIFQNVWITHCISMYSAWFRGTVLRVLKFLQIKEGGPNFWGERILQNVWIIWSPLLYFNFKSFLDPNSSPIISFQCILYDSGVLLLGFSNFYKLRRGDLISRGNQFCGISELFGPPFCISILKVF